MTLRQLWHWSMSCLSNVSIAATLPTFATPPNCLQRLLLCCPKIVHKGFMIAARKPNIKSNGPIWSNRLTPRLALLFAELGGLQVLVEKNLRKHQISRRWWLLNHLQPVLFDPLYFSHLVIPMRFPCGPAWSNLCSNFCVSISEAS